MCSSVWRAFAALLLAALCEGAPAEAPAPRWAGTPQAEMLERLIPPGMTPALLPEPRSAGARLAVAYCTQCHHLPSPAMHDGARWPAVVERMLPRMHGRGNLGPLMRDLMEGVRAPTSDEVRTLTGYLQRHAMTGVAPAALPEAQGPDWTAYTQACGQCHALPAPSRHTRAQWPAVVARMERNMQWMNRVVGSQRDPREPRYESAAILAYLRRHARR